MEKFIELGFFFLCAFGALMAFGTFYYLMKMRNNEITMYSKYEYQFRMIVCFMLAIVAAGVAFVISVMQCCDLNP